MARLRRIILVGWCVVAAFVLLVSAAAHFSTFAGIDPMEAFPGVMFIHVAIFPPFIAALYFANKVEGPSEKRQDKAMNAAPRWLRIMTGVFFAYGLVNFGAFLILAEGGGPDERDGRYVLSSHGRTIRELTEEEFHQHQAYVVRGFSGHWMLFSSAALMILVGTARTLAHAEPSGLEKPADVLTESPKEAEPKEPPPEPSTLREAVVGLTLYVACVAMILSGQPVLGVVCAVPVTVSAILMLRRWGKASRRSFESTIGCLTVFPNAFLASRMGMLVAQFIYLLLFVGPHAAVTHSVSLVFPKAGPTQLSDGTLLNNHAWSALMLLVQFPLFAIGTLGLTHLAEYVGRFAIRPFSRRRMG